MISHATLDALSDEARASARRRKNYNFHAESDPAHRLLNAVEPGSYVQPHRHLDPNKDETFVVVRGSFGVVLFDESGAITETAVAKAGGDVVGVDIPHGIYHSLVSLEKGSVFFEAKAGPYVPISNAERAPWAPKEGEPGVPAYLAQLERLFR
jgi:cupin fold WbuC family metalloprotein